MGTKGGFGGGVSQFTTNPNVLKLLKGGTFGPSAHRSCQSTKQKHFHGPVGVGLLSELHLLLNTLLWKELVDWRSASWVKVGSLTWHGKSSESGILPLNLQPEAISSPGVLSGKKQCQITSVQ